MKRVAISKVCEVNPRLPSALRLDADREVDFIPMANLGEDGRICANGTRKLREVVKGYTYFQNGDVIVAKITPCLENGKAAYVRDLPHQVAFGSTEFHVLRPKCEIDARYLFYMIWNPRFRHEASRNMTGTAGQQRVPAAFLERFEIPLPSLSEQKRIANILDKADAIRRRRREAIKESARFAFSVFHQMFGDPRKNPNKLHSEPLRSLVRDDDKINYGVVQPGQDYFGGVPIVRVGDFGRMRIETANVKRIDPVIEASYKRSRLVGDEVLLACVGSIGLVALADESLHGFNTVRAVARIRCGSGLNRHYLAYYLSTPFLQTYFLNATRTVSQPTLNIGVIEETKILLPPIGVQNKFASIVSKHSAVANHFEDGANVVEQFFNSLLERGFGGEL